MADTRRDDSPPPRPGAAIELEDVTRKFLGTGLVIDRTSLSIASGEFVSLLGPSGSGKSTLLRLIAALDAPDGGSVRVNAYGVEHFRSVVFQEAQLLPWRRVLDNVALPLELIGRSAAEARVLAGAMLRRVGLDDAFHKYPAQLSGGMRMRAALARALVTEPTLLLMDEPFSALDENTRHQLQEQLYELWSRLRMTVVFVTHSVTEAVFLSSRAVLVSRRPARVLLDVPTSLPEARTAELRTDPAFVALVRKLSQAFPRNPALEGELG